jgi:DNA-binding LacI/PurR family transcriptional regulator
MVEERLRGYRETLAAAGLASPELEQSDGVWDPSDGSRMAERLLDLPDPPTAIICGNDLLALGAMRAATLRNLRVPDDLAVAGFNDFEFAEFVEPPLTTVRVPGYELGRIGAERLIARLRGHGARTDAERVALPVELTIRGSA